MKTLPEKYKELLSEIIKGSKALVSREEKLYEAIGTKSFSEDEKLIKALLVRSEESFLKTKAMYFYLTEKGSQQGIEVPEIELSSSMEVYSDKAILFILPPMVSFRKKDEKTNLGRAFWHEMMTLINKYTSQYGYIDMIENPVIKFVHCVGKEDIANKFIPDPDNLDCSKAIDALEAGLIIRSDSILDITLIHEGKRAEKSQTLLYVYEKNKEKDYESPVKKSMHSVSLQKESSAYIFSPFKPL